MALKRCLLEMGIGTDLHGRDYTKAAIRAVKDIMGRNSLSFPRAVGQDPDEMHVKVLIGVPYPDQVDCQRVLAELPYGLKEIEVSIGGMDIPNEDATDSTVIANAAVIVSLDL